MSSAHRKKIQRFAQLDQETGVFRASAYLIAQFGKNYAVGNGMSIRGTELMECTMSVLHDAQEMIGGGLVYLECEEENNQAYGFYIRCGFKEFDHRYSQIDKQSITVPFLRLAAAQRLKLNTTFVMDNRLT